MLLGLVPGVVVGGGVVEFVEADCVAPAGDGAGGLVGLTGVVPGIFGLSVTNVVLKFRV